MDTDRDWEKWARIDPYFGVLSTAEYLSENIDNAARERFFDSGRSYVQWVMDTLSEKYVANYKPARVLDFGCGVGRLLIPFAKVSTQATGVDVSTSMLTEAESNSRKFGVTNVNFFLSDDRLSLVTESFDLVHSALVLQHIPPNRGFGLINELANRVRPGGFLVLQFPFACTAPIIVRALVRLRYAIPIVNYLRNLYKRRPLFEPAMQMHIYDLNRVIVALNSAGYDAVQPVFTRTNNQDFESVHLFCRRN